MVLCLKVDSTKAAPGNAEFGAWYRSRLPIYRSIWICFFGLALAPCAAVAQESDVRDLTNLTLEDLAKARLFTASRHLDDPRKAPAAVTVIDRDEIVRYGWRTLADLLASVTGIYTAYDRTYSYVGVRGYLESGDYNARVLLLVDGHRLNENIYDSALIGTEFPLDLSLIDHVEIVRGPGSALYGTNAELAVINVITRQPDSRPTVEAASLGESFLGRRASSAHLFVPVVHRFCSRAACIDPTARRTCSSPNMQVRRQITASRMTSTAIATTMYLAYCEGANYA